MASSTRGSTRNNPGWLIVGVAGIGAVAWLTAATFGVPGVFVAGATPTTPAATADPAAATSPGRPTGAPSSARTGDSVRQVVELPVLDRPTSTLSGSAAAPSASATAGPSAGPSASPTSSGTGQQAAVLAAQARCPVAARGVQEHASHAAGARTVALTFDDGPGEATPAVLDILAREHVHATFFVIGHEASLHPDLVRRAVHEGHLVGNHTYDHVYPRDLRGGWSTRYLSDQMRRTADVVYRASGQPTCFFRPPGGFLPSTVLPNARRLRMTTALWSVDTRDWQVQGTEAPSGATRGVQARTILYRAVAGGKLDPHPVVLFHDGGGYRGSTAASLTRVIAWYKANGYTFIRLDGEV